MSVVYNHKLVKCGEQISKSFSFQVSSECSLPFSQIDVLKFRSDIGMATGLRERERGRGEGGRERSERPMSSMGEHSTRVEQ